MPPLEDIDLPEGDAASTLHLNPAAEFQPNVLLPGDPARAMAIATREMTAPRMFNHRRGLWGYSGETEAGLGLLVQATGMGGPSAAIVAEEVCDLGAELLLRVGTCGAIDESVKLGDFVVGRFAIGDDGASQALGVSGRIDGDAALADALVEAGRARGLTIHDGAIATVDLFYDPGADARYSRLVADGALVIEMEAAAVYAVGARRGVPTCCLVAVTDELWDQGERKRLSHDEIVELGHQLGDVGVAAVAAVRGGQDSG